MQQFGDNDLAQPRRLSANHAKMLTALADMGCAGPLPMEYADI